MAISRTMAVARTSKKDEFYTQLQTIEDEIDNYTDKFKDKVVYCNCDDARESNFFFYFLSNFERLGLKKLISSSYINREYDLFNFNDEKDKAMSFEYLGGFIEEDLLKNKDIMSIDSIKVKSLKGNGDFRSDECLGLLNEADIIVTNPPFSLFKEFIQILINYKKNFLLIGNNNAITYKDFFHLLKDNKVWPGGLFNKTVEFEVPSNYDKWDRLDELTGKKYASVPAISWWTNMKHDKMPSGNVELTKSYKDNPNDYPKYCNYNAIDVNKLTNIPKDYDGIMGVPITFIGIYNPNQFNILGLGAGEMYKKLGGKVLGQSFLNKYLEAGGKGNYVANQNILGYYNDNGEPIIPYMRILIQSKLPVIQKE